MMPPTKVALRAGNVSDGLEKSVAYASGSYFCRSRQSLYRLYPQGNFSNFLLQPFQTFHFLDASNDYSALSSNFSARFKSGYHEHETSSPLRRRRQYPRRLYQPRHVARANGEIGRRSTPTFLNTSGIPPWTKPLDKLYLERLDLSDLLNGGTDIPVCAWGLHRQECLCHRCDNSNRVKCKCDLTLTLLHRFSRQHIKRKLH